MSGVQKSVNRSWLAYRFFSIVTFVTIFVVSMSLLLIILGSYIDSYSIVKKMNTEALTNNANIIVVGTVTKMDFNSRLKVL